MAQLIGRNNKKDQLFYSDLAYKIKQIAGIEVDIDEEIDDRIKLRQKSVLELKNPKICFEMSDFEFALIIFTREIAKEANVNFTSINDIKKYPELVKEALKELEYKPIKSRSLRKF